MMGETRVRLTDPWRGLLLAAALILAGTAILHILYYPPLSNALQASPLSDDWGPQIEGLWIMFSAHLVIIAVFLTVAAVRARMASDSGLLVCALILAANTGLLGAYMGLFAGTLLVGIAAVLVIVARTIRQVALAS